MDPCAFVADRGVRTGRLASLVETEQGPTARWKLRAPAGLSPRQFLSAIAAAVMLCSSLSLFLWGLGHGLGAVLVLVMMAFGLGAAINYARHAGDHESIVVGPHGVVERFRAGATESMEFCAPSVYLDDGPPDEALVCIKENGSMVRVGLLVDQDTRQQLVFELRALMGTLLRAELLEAAAGPASIGGDTPFEAPRPCDERRSGGGS